MRYPQQIAPEAIRLVAICAIMLTQNWEMALRAVCLLPPYVWLARRAALRLQSNLDPYYQMWEDISRAHRGCDWRGENSPSFRAPKLARKRSCGRNRWRPTKCTCAESGRRRNSISLRWRSAI